MKQRHIDALSMINKEMDAIHVEFIEETERLSELKNAIWAQCDHRWPDGTSAIISTFTCDTCEICPWNDL